jgi:hypothetical protein
MKYYSDQDFIAFADSLALSTDIPALEAWAATSAEDPIYEGAILSEQDLKLHLVDILAAKFPGDSSGIVTAAEVLYEYITGITPTTTTIGETVILINTLNYTDASTAKHQNYIYEFSGGGGTFTLPTDASADGMVREISNTTAGTLTFSEFVYANTGTSSNTLGAAGHIKIVYSHTDNKWFVI